MIFDICKYNNIWNKASISVEKKIDNKPIHIKRVLKTNIKSYDDEATDFHDKEMPKAGSNHTWLAVIMTDSVIEKDENYYLQMFLKE